MAVPPELMAMLGGGGGDPAMGAGPAMGGGAPMDIPPEILAALQGGGGMPPEGAPPEEAPPEGGEGGLYGASGGDNVEALRVALDALKQYAEEEDDDQNIQVVLKCLTALQGILAEEQKMQDGMLGGKMDPRALRRAGAAQGGGQV